MAGSHVAALVQVIQGLSLSPTPGGISPVPLPKGASFPYITVRKVHGTELENLSGRSNLLETVMQVDFWSKDYEEAFSMQTAVKDALLEGIGVSGGSTGFTLKTCNHVNDAELFDDVRELHQLITRFHIWWA